MLQRSGGQGSTNDTRNAEFGLAKRRGYDTTQGQSRLASLPPPSHIAVALGALGFQLCNGVQ
jgi:hypothetical protein